MCLLKFYLILEGIFKREKIKKKKKRMIERSLFKCMNKSYKSIKTHISGEIMWKMYLWQYSQLSRNIDIMDYKI